MGDKTQSSERSEREKFFEKIIVRLYKANILIIKLVHKIHTFAMLKLNIKLLIDSPPPKKKMTMAHLSPSVDRDRRP